MAAASKGTTIPEDLVKSDDPNFRPSAAVSCCPGRLDLLHSIGAKQLIGHLQHHIRDPNRDHRRMAASIASPTKAVHY